MKVEFYKMHGLGNDFVIIPSNNLKLSQQQIINICHRNIGIGCDQLIIIEDIKKPVVKVSFYNNDGTSATACGNGTRCVIWLLNKKFNYKEKVNLVINGKNIIGNVLKNDEVKVDMGEYKLDFPNEFKKSKKFEEVTSQFFLSNYHYIFVGNPHLIFFVDDVDKFNLNKIGEVFNKFEIFPNGINISLAKIIKKNFVKIRTYERGACLTLACGTAAMAVAAAYTKLYDNDITYNEINISMEGGSLNIIVEPNKIHMIGGTSFVFSGIYHI